MAVMAAMLKYDLSELWQEGTLKSEGAIGTPCPAER